MSWKENQDVTNVLLVSAKINATARLRLSLMLMTIQEDRLTALITFQHGKRIGNLSA